MLKSLKTQLCRSCGKSLGIFGSWIGTKNHLMSIIKKFSPESTINPNSSIQDLMNLVKNVSKPFINEVIGKNVVSMFNSIWDNKASLFSSIITSSFSLIPGIGSIIGPAFNIVFETILSNTKDSIILMQEQIVYQQNVQNAFSMLFEVVDPFECIDNMLKETYETVNIS